MCERETDREEKRERERYISLTQASFWTKFPDTKEGKRFLCGQNGKKGDCSHNSKGHYLDDS